jgi:3-hydroxymyristoyl/3-hydroxydecanoyl-(acyl carrier protein) dehydratase
MAATIDLLPHRLPWLLVDRVVARGEGTVETDKLLSANDPLLADGTLPEVLLLEALAQTAACLQTDTLGRHRGLLVAAQRFTVEERPRAGETLRLRAVREAVLGRLVRFAAEARVGERRIASAQMTFAIEPELEGEPSR